MDDLTRAVERDDRLTYAEEAAVMAVTHGRISCRTYWGTHGCGRPRGHELPHVCIDDFPDDDGDRICSIMEPHWHHFGEDVEN